MNFISPNSKSISVLITPSNNNTQSSYLFPTQQELQNRKIVAIETYCGKGVEANDWIGPDILNDPNNPGNAVISPLLFQSAFLTLYTDPSGPKVEAWSRGMQQGLFYDKIPFSSLRRVQNNASTVAAAATPTPSFSRQIFLIRPTELAFNKCKVEFPNTVALTTVQSAVFTFHYLDKGDSGDWWMDAMGFKMHHK